MIPRTELRGIIILFGFFLLASKSIPQQTRGEWADAHAAQYAREAAPPRDIFPGNKFTFCRIKFTNDMHLRGGPWFTDYPDSDLNFTKRLSEMTTIETNPHVIVSLDDDAIFNYPFIYMLEVGTMALTDKEVERLRIYLLRGGFLMVDDFWGEAEWHNWEMNISKVFPPQEYPMTDIPLSHEMFHCVFDLQEIPQIPGVYSWLRTGLSYEREDAKQVHCRGIWDHNNRLMVVVMHNCDMGDGWEEEGTNEDYFKLYSAPKAYPLGINIVVYAMTH